MTISDQHFDTLTDSVDLSFLTAGTSVLVTGATATDQRTVLIRLLRETPATAGTVFLSTEPDPMAAKAACEQLLTDRSGPVGFVGTTEHEGVTVSLPSRVHHRDVSPVPTVPELGEAMLSLVDGFTTHRDGTPTRFGIDSLSTLLETGNVQLVYRFVHILTRRIESAGAIVVFTLDEAAHDEADIWTFKRLFDYDVCLAREPDGSVSMTAERLDGDGADG
ncbi:DUF7504 family protein [Haloarchaeobius sp. DT45]|uniref:DUF7504 family protein n=1 Tax=Haloarchaeobius sp. DT45 TaxID=3446116 RepID=UPI003F6CEA2D